MGELLDNHFDDMWDEDDPRKWSDTDDIFDEIEPFCDLSEPQVCESCQ